MIWTCGLMVTFEAEGNCLCRSGWSCLSHTVWECFQRYGDMGMAAFNTFYLRSNFSWSTRTAANTHYSHCADSTHVSTCSLSVQKRLRRVVWAFCNVLFNDAVVITVSQLIKHGKHFGQMGQSSRWTHTHIVLKCKWFGENSWETVLS